MVVMSERKYSVMELVKMLEEALPKGVAVVVGNGEGLTDEHKAWLHSLTDCEGECDYCEGYTQKDMAEAIKAAYKDGKVDGYEEARRDYEECDECEALYTQEEYDDAVEEAYNEGYADGERSAMADHEQSVSDAYDEGYADALREVKSALCDLMD